MLDLGSACSALQESTRATRDGASHPRSRANWLSGLRVPPAELHETDYRLGEGNGCSNAQEHATNNRDQPDNLAHVIL